MRRQRWKPRNERGSVVLIAAGAVVITGVAALGIGRLGGAVATRAQAGTAADAAALAGAAEGRVAAEQVATANRAELVEFVELGDDVIVRVVIDGIEARARARRE